jgi:DNA-binding NarL/FixJ family response regulator
VISGAIATKILSEVGDDVAARFKDYNRRKGLQELTKREKDILRLLVDGLSNHEIGARLHISEPTVKKALSRVMEKLQQNNRVQTAVYAVRQGLI